MAYDVFIMLMALQPACKISPNSQITAVLVRIQLKILIRKTSKLEYTPFMQVFLVNFDKYFKN